MVVDLFIVYKILRKLTSSFTEWEAYEKGIIDEDGNILIDSATRNKSVKLRNSFSKLDLLVLKLKKLIMKQPLVARKFATMAAALWLIKEDYDIDENLLNEENLMNRTKFLYEEEGGDVGHAPTNNVSKVAGLKNPGVPKNIQKTILRRNKKKFKEDD